MTERNQNIEVHQGDDFTFEVPVLDGENGAPLDLTGAALRWLLAAAATDTVPLIEKTVSGGGVTITDSAGGLVVVTLAPADTASLNGIFHHELEVILGGRIYTVMTGEATIRPRVGG